MKKKDVIIILSGGILENASLSDFSVKRAEKGYELFMKGVSNRILISGRWSFLYEYEPKMTEAKAIKEHLLSLGVNKENILLEEQSVDTIGNAYFCKQILAKKRWKDILVITSDFHVKRTQYVFSKVFKNCEFDISYLGAPSMLSKGKYIEKELSEEKIIRFTKDWIKDVEEGNDKQMEKFLYDEHPGYSKSPGISKEELLETIMNIR